MQNQMSILKSMFYLSLLLFSQNLFSQTVNDSIPKTTADSTIVEKPKRLKFGLGFGLGFVGGTNISLSPNLMYEVNDKLSFGVGLQGSYSAIKNLQNTTTFGANVLGQYEIFKNALTTLEFAQLRVNTKNENPTNKTNKSYWDSAFFLGAGYQITPKISFGAKYNFLYKEGESVYASAVIPFVNIGF